MRHTTLSVYSCLRRARSLNPPSTSFRRFRGPTPGIPSSSALSLPGRNPASLPPTAEDEKSLRPNRRDPAAAGGKRRGGDGEAEAVEGAATGRRAGGIAGGSEELRAGAARRRQRRGGRRKRRRRMAGGGAGHGGFRGLFWREGGGARSPRTHRQGCVLAGRGRRSRESSLQRRSLQRLFFFEITAETSVWVLLLPYGQLRANKLSAVSSLLCNSSQAKNGCFPSVLARYAIRTWRRRNTSASIVCLRSRCGFKSVGGPLVVCNLRL
jgi:hypothetical protein